MPATATVCPAARKAWLALTGFFAVAMLLSDDSLNTYDLIDNGIDLAIRLSPSTESSVVARRDCCCVTAIWK